MVLKHLGMPEFNPPDDYDETQLRGDHIVTFQVVMPDNSPEELEKRAQLLKQFADIEAKSLSKFYGYYDELRKGQDGK